MPSVSSLLDTTSKNEQTLNSNSGNSKHTKVQTVKKVAAKQHKVLEPNKVRAKDFDLDIAQLVYRGVEAILQKDDFDVFATKSKRIHDIRIAKINADIERMIKLNVKAKTDEKKYSSSLTKLKKENDKKIAVLREKLL